MSYAHAETWGYVQERTAVLAKAIEMSLTTYWPVMLSFLPKTSVRFFDKEPVPLERRQMNRKGKSTFPTCTDLEYVQSTLPTVGEVIKDLVECLHKMFKWATGKPLPGIKMCHNIISEQGFNGGL